MFSGFWQKTKRFLTENLNKKYKKIIGRLGKFFGAVVQLSIAVIFWLCSFINEPVISTFLFAVYVAAAELWFGSIMDIFKENGFQDIKEPQ